jgi:hypothetical protein
MRAIVRVIGALLVFGTTAAAQTPIKPAPPSLIRPKAIASPNPSLPDAFKQAHAGETVSGTYEICIDTDGSVSLVKATESIPGVDQAIIDHIKALWRYEPQAIKVCVVRRFLFKIRPPQPIK